MAKLSGFRKGVTQRHAVVNRCVKEVGAVYRREAPHICLIRKRGRMNEGEKI